MMNVIDGCTSGSLVFDGTQGSQPARTWEKPDWLGCFNTFLDALERFHDEQTNGEDRPGRNAA